MEAPDGYRSPDEITSPPEMDSDETVSDLSELNDVTGVFQKESSVDAFTLQFRVFSHIQDVKIKI